MAVAVSKQLVLSDGRSIFRWLPSQIGMVSLRAIRAGGGFRVSRHAERRAFILVVERNMSLLAARETGSPGV
jgi:hypothetical protein